MGIFNKDGEAKARRTQERVEQQRKANVVPPPYVHTPTHAFNDALLSAPHAYEGTDKQKLKEAHENRLHREASAIAAGSDTNVTNIPAKYWQGQTLPAQFEAPTPAKLRKLALSRRSLRGKDIEMPETLPTREEAQQPVHQAHVSGLRRSKASTKLRLLAATAAQDLAYNADTDQSFRDHAAEVGKELELERLRRRIRELEGYKEGTQAHRGRGSYPSILIEQPAQNNKSPKIPAAVAPASAPPHHTGSEDTTQSRSSSSDVPTTSRSSSARSTDVNSSSTPTSTSPGRSDSGGDGVSRYDWAIHWERVAARTDEERAKLPSAVDPKEHHVAPRVKEEPHDSHPSHCESASTLKPKRNSGRRRVKALWPFGSVSAESKGTATGPKPTDDTRDSVDMVSSYSHKTDLESRFTSANKPSPLRHYHFPSRHKG